MTASPTKVPPKIKDTSSGFRQAEIQRVIAAVRKAGGDVAEVIVSRESIRVLSSRAVTSGARGDSWGEVLEGE